MLSSLLNLFFEFLKIPIIIAALLFGIWFLIILVFIAVYRKKSDDDIIWDLDLKLEKNFIYKIFVQAPRMIALDFLRRNPDEFIYQGCIIFTGKQGRGKTISLVEYMMRMQRAFPKCNVITNLDYVKEDTKLNHWKQLCNYKNGIYGVICAIDETQNWFSCNQSKDFPPEMLTVITQNRKNRRVILGTAQSFHLLSKAIRTQCTEVRECRTFFNCITVVTRKEPKLDSEGNVIELEKLGRYWYVHTDVLRKSYDTYKTIDNLVESGFVGQVQNA